MTIFIYEHDKYTVKIEVNTLSFYWLLFGNGHHFIGTRIQQKLSMMLMS